MSVTRIYQFSDLPLVLKNQAVKLDYSTVSTGEVNNFIYTHKKYTSSQRYVTEPTEITFEGILMNDSYLNQNSLEQRLRSLVGFPENLICYLLPNEYPKLLDDCLCPEGCECKIIWVNTQAILTSVEVETDDDFTTKTITLTFTLLDYFAPLNPLYFRFDGVINTIIRPLETPATVNGFRELITCFPQCDELFQEGCLGCKFFSRRNYDFFDFTYNTKFWEASSCTECCDSYSMGLDFYELSKNGTTEPVNIDNNVWSAPPISIYAFQSRREVDDDVIVSIKVNYMNGSVYKQEVTTVEFLNLNTLMVNMGLGRFGSNSNVDILYLGNINYYFNNRIYRPSFVMRNGSIIPNLHPLINYPSFSPAQIYAGKNDVYIGAKKTIGSERFGFDGLNYAFFHSYRRI